MLGSLRGQEGVRFGLLAAGMVEERVQQTAAIEVRMMPSPKIGFSASGKMWKKFGDDDRDQAEADRDRDHQHVVALRP